ncbi:MAG: hypothetical protein HRT61_16790 [Ekhidna sp.]|nr:hypothetical protein [Ekhidna sp.]
MKYFVLSLLLFSALSALAQDENLIAAGILPYTITNDTVYLLLGYDDDKPGWTDFGGGRELIGSLNNDERPETPREIAVREFFEECRMVYGKELINLRFRPEAYIDAVNGVYRSYLVNIPFKSRDEMREAMIPVDKRFKIFREKSDFFWISLYDLKSSIRSGSNRLEGSPNKGILYKHFYDTLKQALQDDSVDQLFVKY